MKNSKLINILETLAVSEQKTMLKSIRDSHLAQNGVSKIAAYLLANKFKKGDRLSKASFFEFCNKKSNDKEFNNIQYQAKIAFEEYLILKAVREKKINKEYLLALIYKENGNRKLFFEKLDKAKAFELNQEQTEMWNLAKLMHLNHMSYFTPHTEKLSGTVSIEQCMQRLDQFVSAAKIKYSSELINCHNILHPTRTEIRLLTAVLDELSQTETKDIPLFTIGYLHALEMMDSLAVEKYHALKDWFLANNRLLSLEDRHVLLIYLLNFCAAMAKKSQSKTFGSEMWELTVLGIEENILTMDGFITPTKFINFVETCCMMEDLGLCSNFIEQFQKKLHIEERKNTVDFAQARLLFHQKEYEKVLLLLRSLPSKNVYLNIRWRELQIRSLYEQDREGYEPTIRASCEKFRKYLHNNKKLDEKHSLACSNFLTVMRMLLNNKKEKSKIHATIDGFEHLYFRIWLVAKVGELPMRYGR